MKGLAKPLALLAGLSTLAAAPGPTDPPLRVGVPAAQASPCRPIEAWSEGTNAGSGEAAYFRHIQRRLKRQVLRCPLPFGEAATALATNKVDMAALGQETFAPVRETTRAFLTLRREGALTRVPVVLAVRTGERARLRRGATLTLAGNGPAGRDLPRQVLSEQGMGKGYFAAEIVAPSEDDALQKLRARHADVIALHAGAWQRLCRGDTPTETPCADLEIIWRARPTAELAWGVRRDMPEALRYQLVGIHLPMHLENTAAFQWAADQIGEAGANFEPAEALALAGEPLR